VSDGHGMSEEQTICLVVLAKVGKWVEVDVARKVHMWPTRVQWAQVNGYVWRGRPTLHANNTGNLVAMDGERRTGYVSSARMRVGRMRGGGSHPGVESTHIAISGCIRPIIRDTHVQDKKRGNPHDILSLYGTPAIIIFLRSSVALVSSIHGGWCQCSSGTWPKCAGPETRFDTRLWWVSEVHTHSERRPTNTPLKVV